MNLKKPIAFLLAGTLCVPSFTAFPIAEATSEAPALLDVSTFTIRDENLVYLGADYLNAELIP